MRVTKMNCRGSFLRSPRGARKGLPKLTVVVVALSGQGAIIFFFASARVNGGKSAAVRALSIGRRDVDCARD